jgi:competence protein ComEC
MPLFWLSSAYLLGLAVSSALAVHWGIWASLAGVGVALTFFEDRLSSRILLLLRWRQFGRLRFGLLLVVFGLGIAHFQFVQPRFTEKDLAFYNDKGQVRLVGVISAPPDWRDRTVLLRVEVSELTILEEGAQSQRPEVVRGTLLARLPTGVDWKYGDVVSLGGKLLIPPENEEFSYRDYLAGRGIYSYMTYARIDLVRRDAGNPFLAAIYNLRERAYEVVNRLYTQPEAALLAGILLGMENDIPFSLERAFQDTGTAHIIAISGFNIAILAGLFASITSRFVPRFWSPLVSIFGITVYTILVGAQPPVMRAAIMGSMALFGRQIGRKHVGANSLFFTAAIMCAFNPLLLRDAGFQLSAMATLGLITFAEPLVDAFERLVEMRTSTELAHRLAGPVGEYFLFTLAAQVTTLPVIAFHFERFSLSSFLANILILPPQPLVMILGGIAVIAGLVFFPLGQILAYLAWPLVAYTNHMVELLAKISSGVLVLGEIPQWAVFVFYVLLFGATFGRKQLLKARRWVTPVVIIMGLVLLNAVLLRSVLSAPDGRLHLTALDLPEGPAVLVQGPGGQSVLINSSSSASQLSSALGQRLSLFDRHLDAVVLTIQASAPLDGLPVTLERFPPHLVLWDDDLLSFGAGRRLADILERQDADVQVLQSGQRLRFGESAVLEVLLKAPSGTALLLEWERFRALIPGGVSMETLDRYVEDKLVGVDVLILSPLDFETGAAQDWLTLRPVMALWSNDGPQVVFPEAPRWLNISRYDWVKLSTDGTELWVEAR